MERSCHNRFGVFLAPPYSSVANSRYFAAAATLVSDATSSKIVSTLPGSEVVAASRSSAPWISGQKRYMELQFCIVFQIILFCCYLPSLSTPVYFLASLGRNNDLSYTCFVKQPANTGMPRRAHFSTRRLPKPERKSTVGCPIKFPF